MITLHLRDAVRAGINKDRKFEIGDRFYFPSIFFQFPHRYIVNYMFYFIDNMLGGKIFGKGINNIGNEIAKRLFSGTAKIGIRVKIFVLYILFLGSAKVGIMVKIFVM